MILCVRCQHIVKPVLLTLKRRQKVNNIAGAKSPLAVELNLLLDLLVLFRKLIRVTGPVKMNRIELVVHRLVLTS